MTRVFVGGLPEDVRERDLSDKFAAFGRISSIAIKFPPRAPPFGFIDYDEESDANEAVKKMDGRDFQGRRLRIEISRSGFSRPGEASKRLGTQYRVQLSNLPPRMTWMEVKDFLRDGGDVVQVNVDRRGGGTASFATYDEMKHAIRTLDRRELEGERTTLTVEIWFAVAARSIPLAPSRSEVAVSFTLEVAVALAVPAQSSLLPLPLAVEVVLALSTTQRTQVLIRILLECRRVDAQRLPSPSLSWLAPSYLIK